MWTEPNSVAIAASQTAGCHSPRTDLPGGTGIFGADQSIRVSAVPAASDMCRGMWTKTMGTLVVSLGVCDVASTGAFANCVHRRGPTRNRNCTINCILLLMSSPLCYLVVMLV